MMFLIVFLTAARGLENIGEKGIINYVHFYLLDGIGLRTISNVWVQCAVPGSEILTHQKTVRVNTPASQASPVETRSARESSAMST